MRGLGDLVLPQVLSLTTEGRQERDGCLRPTLYPHKANGADVEDAQGIRGPPGSETGKLPGHRQCLQGGQHHSEVYRMMLARFVKAYP